MLEGNPRAPRRDRQDRGVTSVEYSLATVGVAGLLIAAVFGLGNHLAEVFDCMSRQLSGPTATCEGSVDETGPVEDPPPGPDPTGTSDPTAPGTDSPTNSPTGSSSPSGSPTGSPSPSTPSPSTPSPSETSPTAPTPTG